jgi:two-component system chemotaxis sensor kinase CheA
VSQPPDERTRELRELFFETAQELLQALNEEALKLEKNPGDPEVVRGIRRIVHTLKGDAAACGYRELSELAHELEDALAAENAASPAALAEVAFAAADTFSAFLAAHRGKGKLPAAEPLRKMIRKLAQDAGGGKRRKKKLPTRTAVKVAWTEYEQMAIQHALDHGRRVYHVAAQIDPECAMPIAARQLMHNALGSIGEILAARPEAGSSEAAQGAEFVVATDKSSEQICAKCQIPAIVAQVKVAEIKGSGRKAKPASPSTPPAGPNTSTHLQSGEGETAASLAADEAGADSAARTHSSATENILRVDAERIDAVLNLVGELIIGKSMLQQTVHELTRHHPKDALRGRLADAMAFQARVLNELQRSVMKIRMVPVEQLFRRFPRIIRDVARQCGKEVELVISGEKTDLDKGILDAIAEPLTHLVRNAVGHGIESAAERRRLGKPAQGTIRLDAYHQGNQVIVQVSDDGRGIDAQRVKAKALEQGLISADEAARLTESEILDFIFRPGFSTAEEITEIAGRGVGLDVVQSVLHRLKGKVDIETRPGQGTRFRLEVPLTLAIIKALLFRVERHLYAIPLNAVTEIARACESDLHQVGNYEVVQLRGQVLSLVRLGQQKEAPTGGKSPKVFVLVIAAGDKKFGLIVDALEGEEELVIKALDDQSVSTDLISGASILGDGRVVLILNVATVVERFLKIRLNETGEVVSGLLLSHADRVRLESAKGAHA